MRQEQFLARAHDKNRRHNPRGDSPLKAQPDIHQNQQNADSAHNQGIAAHQPTEQQAGANANHVDGNLILRRFYRQENRRLHIHDGGNRAEKRRLQLQQAAKKHRNRHGDAGFQDARADLHSPPASVPRNKISQSSSV